MFYRPAQGHGLPHNPFNAIVAPRPIAWIATRGALGDNLAPYSFFNAVASAPPQVMFSSSGSKADRGDTKDSIANIRETGVFSISVVAAGMAAAMNETTRNLPAGQDEFAAAGILRAECTTISCPRVAEAPATLECRLTQIVTLAGRSNHMVIGEVTGIHLRDDCLVDGRFDITRFGLLTRLGYQDYAVVSAVFPMPRPD